MPLELAAVPKEHARFVDALVRSLKEAADDGQGSFTFLVGPSGMGQDRIVEAALRRASIQDLNLHRVPLSRADTSRPFYPVTSLIRRASERARELSPAYSLFLTPFLSPGTPSGEGRTLGRGHARPAPLSSTATTAPPARAAHEPSTSSSAEAHQRLLADLEFYKRGVEAWGDRSRFIHEVGEAISALSREEPTLWLLERAEHLDPHTWSVIRYLAGRLPEVPLVLWATFDVPEGGALPTTAASVLAGRGVNRLDIPALSREGVEAVLARWVPRATLAPQFVDIVEKVSGGRPVYVEEIARGQPTTAGRGLSFKVGERGAEGMAFDRAARLPEDDRQLLTELSFLGSYFPLRMASQVVELPAPVLEKELKDLVEEGFLYEHPGPVYSFALPSLADQLREAASPADRQRLHQKIAEALELTSSSQREETLLLADHWWDAQEWDKAAESNLKAAQFALRAFAPEAALRYASRAREAAEKAPRSSSSSLARVLVEEGQALYDLGRLKDSRKALEGALKRVGKGAADWPLRARALFLLARTLGSLGKGEETFPLVQEANEAFSLVKDVRGQLMLHQVVGVSLMMTGQNEEAAVHFRAQLRLADELEDERERSYAQKNLSAVLLSIDPHSSEGMDLVAAALEHHQRTENFAGLAAGHLNRALTYLDLGEKEKALEDLDRSRLAAEQAHAPLLVSSAVLTEAQVLLDSNEAGRASRVLRRLEPWVGTMEAPQDRAGYLILLGRVMEAQDRLHEAQRAYVRALREVEPVAPCPELWETHLRLALLARREGHGAEAEAHRKALPPASQLAKSTSPTVTELLKAYDGAS